MALGLWGPHPAVWWEGTRKKEKGLRKKQHPEAVLSKQLFIFSFLSKEKSACITDGARGPSAFGVITMPWLRGPCPDWHQGPF